MPYQPTYAYPAPSSTAPRPSRGLSVASFVLGIVALLGCVVPLVNIFGAVLGAVSIAMGVAALVAARQGRALGKGLAVAGIVLSTLGIVGTVVVDVVLFSNVVRTGGLLDEILDEQGQQDATVEAPEQFPGATVHDVVADPGETVSLHDLSVTTTPLRVQQGAAGPFVCATVTYVNDGSGVAIVGAADWILQEPGGLMRAPDVFGAADLQQVELEPSGSVTGDLCFPGAASPGEHVLLFDDGRLDEETLQAERGAWLTTL